MDLNDLILQPPSDPAPDDALLSDLYVPRQELAGGTGGLEDAVLRDLTDDRRVALVGPSGSGKTSLVHWLAANDPSLATVSLPLSRTSVAVGDPAAVLNGCVAAIRHLISGPADSRPPAMLKRVTIGFNWAVFKGDAEWGEAVRAHQPSTDALAATEVLQQVVAGLRSAGSRLVVVFDDTDKWAVNNTDGQQAVADFFKTVLAGWLARLDGALVASVHTHYVDADHTVLDGFTGTHRLRPLDNDEVRRLLFGRFGRFDIDLADHATDAAIVELVATYRTTLSLRHTIRLLRSAMDEAISVGADRIDAPHVIAVS
jgi:hypothetical protein